MILNLIIMKTFGDLIPGDKIFSFNENNRTIFIDEIKYIWFDKDHMGLRLIPILNADDWIFEFDGFIENKYLNQSYMNRGAGFISPDEELFFSYINENI